MAFPDIENPLAGSFGSKGRSLFGRIKRLGTVKLVLGATALVLVADHLMAPRGMSYASKAWSKIAGGRLLPAPPIPPPGVTAKGYFAGANRQAGNGWGYMPAGGWALNTPAGPNPYAHAEHGQRGWFPGSGQPWFPWAE
jgi:hypothetical protein